MDHRTPPFEVKIMCIMEKLLGSQKQRYIMSHINWQFYHTRQDGVKLHTKHWPTFLKISLAPKNHIAKCLSSFYERKCLPFLHDIIMDRGQT